LSGAANAALNLCDWARVSAREDRLGRGHQAEAGPSFSPFTLLGYSADASLHLQCGQDYLKDRNAECRDAPRAAIPTGMKK